MSDESNSFNITIYGNFEDYFSGEVIENSEDKIMDLDP